MAKRVREAHQSGYGEGEAAGKAQGEDEVRAALERLTQSIAGVDEYRTRLYRQTEVDAVRLSVAIARRVLRRELTVDPSAIEGLVSAALQRLQSQETCRVKMHPDYIPSLSAAIERMGMTAKIEVVADPAQEPGAAVFEMPRGNLDASIDSQLREIERGLVDRFQRP
jgi:flagellar assembly protein FliH